MNGTGFTETGIGGDLNLFPPAKLAKLRVAFCYLFRHQKFGDFDNPVNFTELVQRRKMQCRDQRMPMLADKLAVKSFVDETLGSDWLIPTLWHGTELPETPEWPLPFVLKSRHGCNQNFFFRDGTESWPDARKKANGWLTAPYGLWLDEWLYAHIPRGFLIEPFVGGEGRLPVDYKIYTFGGRATHVQVHLDREKRHRWMLFDADWNRVSAPSDDAEPVPPVHLAEMLSAAERLGKGFDYVRSDFYEVGDRPLFGEMTFYPGSGLDKFNPISLDRTLGQYWLDAGGR